MDALEALALAVKALLESGWTPIEIEAQTRIAITDAGGTPVPSVTFVGEYHAQTR